MPTIVFLAVLAAALLHAVWNALVKGGSDKFVGMTAIVLGQLAVSLVALAFVPFPARESWPLLAGSIALHIGYQSFLLLAYRVGDLTQVYPIARGSAPLMVAAISVGFLGVVLARTEMLAILVITAGIMSLGLTRHHDGMRNGSATAFALVTGLFIAGYSLVDGTGARLSGSPVAYFALTCIGNAAVFCPIVEMLKPGTLRRVPVDARATLLVGGTASFVAYSLVVWAFTKAPIALVSALREVSIVFALLIGVLMLGERLNLARLASTMLTLLGAALLRLAR